MEPDLGSWQSPDISRSHLYRGTIAWTPPTAIYRAYTVSKSWPRSNPLSHWFRVQSICLLFVSWQSDHFWLRYSKFHIWPWKFKVKSDGHIWGLEFNWCVCFSFHGNCAIFGRDIANFIFDLENSRSRSRPRSNPMVTFEVLRSIDMFAFRFVAITPFLAQI